MSRVWQDLTDMVADEDLIAEMQKKYRNTWLRLRWGNQDVLALYRGYEDGYHLFKDKRGENIKLSHTTDIRVSIYSPRRGMYNTDEGVVFFWRNPYRQFRRGLNPDSGMVIKLYTKLLGIPSANHIQHAIYSIFDKDLQKEVTLDDAIQKTKEFGEWAINRQFALTLNHLRDEADSYSLFYEDVYIAEVKNNIIHMITPLLYQEVLDTYREWAPNYVVRV